MLTLMMMVVLSEAESYSGKVLLVSMDGFRWDYVKNVSGLRHFPDMAATGCTVDYVNATFITKTYPCHYSIVTGQWMLSVCTVLSYVRGCFLSLQYCHRAVDVICLYSIVIIMSVAVFCLYSIVICPWMFSVFTDLSKVSGCFLSLQYCHMSVGLFCHYSIVICQWMFSVFTVLSYVSGCYHLYSIVICQWMFSIFTVLSQASGCYPSLRYSHMSVDVFCHYSIVTGQWMFSVFTLLSYVSGCYLSLQYCYMSVDVICFYSIVKCQWT